MSKRILTMDETGSTKIIHLDPHEIKLALTNLLGLDFDYTEIIFGDDIRSEGVSLVAVEHVPKVADAPY